MINSNNSNKYTQVEHNGQIVRVKATSPVVAKVELKYRPKAYTGKYSRSQGSLAIQPITT